MKEKNFNNEVIESMANEIILYTLEYLSSNDEDDGIILEEFQKAIKFSVYNYCTCLKLSEDEMDRLCENINKEIDEIIELHDAVNKAQPKKKNEKSKVYDFSTGKKI